MKTAISVLLVALAVVSVGTTGTVGTATLPTDSETAPINLEVTLTDLEAAPTDSSPKKIDSCTTISDAGTYVITRDISEGLSEPPCIQVNASDVIIDGQGHVIDIGGERNAISVGADDRRLSNVTVKNIEASGLTANSGVIKYESVDDGTVVNVTLSGNWGGVLLVNSSNISVSKSTLQGSGGLGATTSPSSYGVTVTDTSDAVIAANTFSRFTRGRSIEINAGSRNATIANNHLRGCVECADDASDDGVPKADFDPNMPIYSQSATIGQGVVIDGAVGTTVVNNTVEYRTNGVALRSGTSNTVVARNTISHTQNGVRVVTASPWHTATGTTVIENNTITKGAVGVEVDTHNGTLRIRNNELIGNDYGVYASEADRCPPRVKGTEDVEVHRNAIVNNSQYGIVNELPVTLTATQNYWGAPSGPSSANDSKAPLEDPVTGTLADGEGDAVSENPEKSGLSNVHFDPWLNQSVTNAS